MVSCNSDDESLSQPLLPECDVTNSDLSVGVPNTNLTIQNNNPTDGENQTTVSSLTTLGTCHPVSTVDHKSYLSHPYYAVLNGGRRSLLKNMDFRIGLLNSILALEPSSYLPKEICNEPHVKRWFSLHNVYLTAPRKWNRANMAKAICELDSIMK